MSTTTSLSRKFDREVQGCAKRVSSARVNLGSRATDDLLTVDDLVRAVHEVSFAVGQQEAWTQSAPIVEYYGDNTAGAAAAVTRQLTDLLLDGADDQHGDRRNDARRVQFDGFRQATTEIFSFLNLATR